MGTRSKTEGVLARDREYSMEAFMKAQRPTIWLLELANSPSPTMSRIGCAIFEITASSVNYASHAPGRKPCSRTLSRLITTT